MLGVSKILTVSYGTFSCTLEGFDEPFNTMKAIAEYFRDLAAEDRYFGAEPPTPDAAMLHKIAEREIQRRVEAKIQDNGVILRADAAEAGFAALSPNVAPAVRDAAAPEAAGESIATRLSRLRANLDMSTGASVAEPVAEPPKVRLVAETPAAAERSSSIASITDQLDEVYIEDQHAGDMGLDMLASVEALVANTAQDADPEVEADLPEPAPAPASEAELAQSAQSLHAPEALADLDLDLVPLAEISAAPMVEVAESDDLQDQETEALLANLGSQTAAAPLIEAPQPQAAARPQSAEEALAEALGIDAPAARAMIGLPEPELEPELEPEPAAPPERARARVLHVRRAQQNTPEPEPAALLSKDAEASLVAEIRALQEEAAAPVQTAPLRATRPLRVLRPASAPAAVEEPAESHQGLTDLSKEEAVTRLIAQTNSALDGPEARRRSAAISHLKAAVAATEADRQMHDSAAPQQTDPKSAYRDDLVSAARTPAATRPGSDRPSPLVLVSEQRIDRPKSDDHPAFAQPAPPVSPRRLVSAALSTAPAEMLIGDDFDDEDEDDEAEITAEVRANIFTDQISFAEFAETLGAESLHDLLEASAVYCAQVLGRAQFSRTLVMHQIDSLPEASKHRLEDQLRAFGTLMREGRITKVKRGGFAITDRSPLLAEALRNAG
jgi:hypothetical protein